MKPAEMSFRELAKRFRLARVRCAQERRSPTSQERALARELVRRWRKRGVEVLTK